MREPYAKLPLSKVARIERGRFSARPRNDPKYYGGEIPFLQTGDIARAGRIIQGWTQTLNELGLGVSKMFPRGTIFMSIAANIGDVAISGFDAACPDSVVAVKPRNGADSEWLFQSLKFSKNDLAALSTQNAQANLSLEKIEPFRIPVPPLPEQRKIAEILRTWDEALEKVTALHAAKVRRISSLRQRLFEAEYASQKRLQRAKDLFETVSERARPDLPLLAVMQDIGIVRRDELDRRVAMPDGDTSTYKVVRPDDFVISLRSFEGGLEYSSIIGLVSPAYTVLRPTTNLVGDYYRHFFKSRSFIARLGLLRTDRALRTRFFDELNALMDAALMKIFASVIDKEKHRAKYANPWNPYEIALHFCMERLQAMMNRFEQHGKKVHVAFESRGAKEDAELELEFRRIASNQSHWGYRRHDFSRFDFQPVFIPKAANASGLQLADLTARPIALSRLRPGQPNRAFEIIEPKLGGLKCFP